MQLKPQDFLVALKLVAWGEQRWTYARLAQELGISVSEAAYFGECDRSFRRIVTGGLSGDFSSVSVT